MQHNSSSMEAAKQFISYLFQDVRLLEPCFQHRACAWSVKFTSRCGVCALSPKLSY